jgi:ubiquinone biosynthesis protein UbiJ
MLDQFASNIVVTALNRLLAYERWARDRLAPFVGQCARIECGPFAVQFGVRADCQLEASDAEPTVTIAMDLAAMPQALVEPRAAMRNVRLSGDAEFAQALSYVLQNLRPEPAEELSRFVGDAAAERIVGLVRAVLAQVQEGGQRFATAAATYFVAENPLLVARAEADAFARDVSVLRDAVERLDKRLDHLTRTA